MFIKRHKVKKDGKEHFYYSLCESVRVGPRQTIQKRLLNLGELNSTQLERWQRSIEVLHEDGQTRQMRLFTDRDGGAPKTYGSEDPDAYGEVLLSSLQLRRPRQFGAPWLGCLLWRQLHLDQFWHDALKDRRGPYSWAKVLELLAVNRLCDPGSELAVHERWFSSTAMDFLLESDEGIAAKDRLYRALDKAIEHKEELMGHLQGRWENLFDAECQILLYDLTSTYFEGQAKAVTKAKRGYSRDHRPDCVQVVVALIVSAEGFPLSYEVFPGNTVDVTTLEEMVETIESKYGFQGRVWVFDRGIVSEENLENLRARGACYLVGTPKSQLREFEKELLQGEWEQVEGRPGVQVKLIPQDQEVYILARSQERAGKESGIRRRKLVGLHRSLKRVSLLIRNGRLKDPDKIQRRLGRLEERYSGAWSHLKEIKVLGKGRGIYWRWDKNRLRNLRLRDGAYLLRTNMDPMEPEIFWRQYVQLTDVESAFRSLKSELAIRPIWHHKEHRVEAHILVAFLGYCLWVNLKAQLKKVAGSITPARVLQALKNILMVDVWFDLRDGRKLCLPRITQPEKEQALLLHQLNLLLPAQPPPRVYNNQVEAGCSDNQGHF